MAITSWGTKNHLRRTDRVKKRAREKEIKVSSCSSKKFRVSRTREEKSALNRIDGLLRGREEKGGFLHSNSRSSKREKKTRKPSLEEKKKNIVLLASRQKKTAHVCRGEKKSQSSRKVRSILPRERNCCSAQKGGVCRWKKHVNNRTKRAHRTSHEKKKVTSRL